MKQVKFLYSISNKLIIAILFLPVIVTTAVFFLFQQIEYHRIKDFSETRLSHIEEASSELLVRERALFREKALRLAIDNQIIVPLKLNVQFQLGLKLQLLKKQNDLDYLSIIPVNGRFEDSGVFGKKTSIKETRFSEIFKEATGGNETVVYNFINGDTPQLYLVSFAPVFSNKRLLAVLFAAKKVSLSPSFKNCMLVSYGHIQSITDNALFVKPYINEIDSIRSFGRILLGDNKIFVSKAPIPGFNNQKCYIISAVDGRSDFKEYRRIIVVAATVFLVILFVLVGYSILLSNRLLKPMNELVAIANDVKADKKDVCWLDGRKDEFGVLSNALKKMTGNLQSSIDELHQANVKVNESHIELEAYRMNLETMVDGRTRELSEALADLRNTQAQLVQSEKMASIGQLAAGVAHEINNPISFVNSNINSLLQYNDDITELLRLYNELKIKLKSGKETTILIDKINQYEEEIDIEFLLDDCRDLIDDCLKGLDRVKNIVADLKDFSHPGDEQLKEVDIESGIEATLNIIANELKYKAVVKKDYGNLQPVLGMPQQLNQVFMNIFVNAAQAMDEPGEISIKTTCDASFNFIEISDTGCGIAEENISKIFDPFFTTKEVGKGTGLGMNIVYNIVKKHDGMITVDSQINKGTTFTIKLPVMKENDSPVHDNIRPD